jgi:hypothetical protein
MRITKGFQSYNAGYDALSSGEGLPSGSNASLRFVGKAGEPLPLYVFDVTASFGLTGTTAQSRKTRSFFPHNSNPPQILVSCQAPNQYYYGWACEFIREHQQTLQEAYLSIPPKGIAPANYHHRGKHQSLSGYGYVQTIRRRHERFVPAPEFTFTFVISKFESKRFNDHAVPAKQMMSWKDIIEAMQARDAKIAYGEVKRPDTQTPAPDDPDDTSDASGYTKGPGRPD